MEARRALEVLAEVLRGRSAHFRQQERYGVALAEGERFIIDPSAEQPLSETWSDDRDVTVFTNHQTLVDMAEGRFDPDALTRGQLFLYEGDTQALERLGFALGTGRSVVGVRVTE